MECLVYSELAARDIEEALRSYTENCGWGPWNVYEYGPPLLHDTMLRGAIAGMFWRFLVADDPSVDRFIVRDSDSRLNARDAFAVVDWIRSDVGAN